MAGNGCGALMAHRLASQVNAVRLWICGLGMRILDPLDGALLQQSAGASAAVGHSPRLYPCYDPRQDGPAFASVECVHDFCLVCAFA